MGNNNKDFEELKARMKQLMAGHDTLAEAIGISLEDILALSVVARQLAEQGQLDDAQTLMEGLVALDPQNPFLHTGLGCVYMQKNLNDAALSSFQVALGYDAQDVAAYTFAGEICLEKGWIEPAIDYFQKAVALDPEGKDPYANRARTSALLVSTIAKEVQQKGPGVLQEIIAEAKKAQAAPPA